MTESQPQTPTYLPPEPTLPTSGLAIASLISGIGGFFLLPIVLSVVALWTGYAARQETRSQPPRASGDGMATAGIIMGYVQLALAFVGACCLCVLAVWFLIVIAQQGQ
jgi:hypothetical protein